MESDIRRVQIINTAASYDYSCLRNEAKVDRDFTADVFSSDMKITNQPTPVLRRRVLLLCWSRTTVCALTSQFIR